MNTQRPPSPPIYLDHAATTRCSREALEVLSRFTADDYGNPSSAHEFGQKGATAIWKARQFFASTYGVPGTQVIFTGGGTESDNLAIQGIALQNLALRGSKTSVPSSGPPPRILISAIEHPAVRVPALQLRDFGFDVQVIPVNSKAQIDESAFLTLLSPETILISIQQVNNIVGSLLPVERLAALAKRHVPGVIFHSDCIQAFTKAPLPVGILPDGSRAVDLVSISAHKIEGPKGVGALIVLNQHILKKNLLRPLIWGGAQEGGLRSGTQNAGLISAFHISAQCSLNEQNQRFERIAGLRQQLEYQLKSNPRLSSLLELNSPDSDRIPQILSLSIRHCPSGPLSRFIEDQGFLISTGSACSSAKQEPDAVLTAMGFTPERATQSLRVSLSACNTPEEVIAFVQALEAATERVIKIT